MGKKDKEHRKKVAARNQKIKGAQMHIIDEAGHLVFVEKSSEVNETIEKFVNNLWYLKL